MLYTRITRWSDLPGAAPQDVPESFALDFKGKHTANAAERAKDMAAFANVLGGTILVGAAENADSYERALLPVAEAQQAARDYEDAARDLLAPTPFVDAVVIRCPSEAGRALVAVNVEPFPGQLVGAKLPNAPAWRFPVRTASRHTAFLDPVHMMIHGDPKTRKAAILLGSIPTAERRPMLVQLMQRYEMEIDRISEEMLDGELVDVVPTRNTVILKAMLDDRSEIVDLQVPLEDVESVWKGVGGWCVRLAGSLVFRRNREGRRTYRYMSGRGPYNWG